MLKNILVTGGAGYIGSHTVAELKSNNFSPVILDNFIFGHEDIVRNVLNVPYYKGDIQDEKLLEKIFIEHKISSVMHFSAYCYVGESVQSPLKYYRNNVVSTLNLLAKMVEFDIKHFVFSSTCATYGVPQSDFIDETHPQNPINPYGMSKLMVEKILKDFDHAYGLKSVVLRYFNACGAHPALKLGEDHEPETHLIPLAIKAALGLIEEVKIFGTDYSTKDGTCIRDYVHVLDLANAHILALDYLQKNNVSNFFNLGNDNGHSVKEIIEAVQKVTGKKIKVVEVERREGDPSVLVSSSDKAKKELGWNPRWSDLKTVIDHAYQWHKFRHGPKVS